MSIICKVKYWVTTQWIIWMNSTYQKQDFCTLIDNRFFFYWCQVRGLQWKNIHNWLMCNNSLCGCAVFLSNLETLLMLVSICITYKINCGSIQSIINSISYYYLILFISFKFFLHICICVICVYLSTFLCFINSILSCLIHKL